MAKNEKLTVKLTRKQVAPRNLAARSLQGGQFQPRVEADPKAYKRRGKHKRDPLSGIDESEEPKT
ncbi:hypothetical protein [Devosia sp.]|mgnify:FL=1|uniref:DUF7230 family protein n=1 Tax=Devosia sp. TaxID=1871048 RepID=UPI001AD46923|nr:hypothetical protein [Devosia sp.]MBN9311037.1 hypothetical protein [Devosia sp.]